MIPNVRVWLYDQLIALLVFECQLFPSLHSSPPDFNEDKMCIIPMSTTAISLSRDSDRIEELFSAMTHIGQ